MRGTTKDKYISLIPVGGLCNRLRAVMSAVNIAVKTGVPCKIYWNKDKSCNCRFSDLFETPHLDGVYVIENTSMTHSIGGKENPLPFILQILRYDTCIYNFGIDEENEEIFRYIKPRSKKILLRSCYQMYNYDAVSMSVLRPRKEIMDRVDDIAGKFGKRTIGLHIRGTDNIQSKTHSPFETFASIIEKKLSIDEDTNFFLATDEEKYKRRMKEMFGKRIITCRTELERGSVEGMKGALTDLYCLSRTDYIIGSYFSSFSEIAALIGGKKEVKALAEPALEYSSAESFRVRFFSCPVLGKSLYYRTFGR